MVTLASVGLLITDQDAFEDALHDAKYLLDNMDDLEGEDIRLLRIFLTWKSMNYIRTRSTEQFS